MKFLITGHPGNVPIPPALGVALYQAAKEWVDARLADGSMDCHYVFAESGGFAISNADSHEDLFAALQSYPLYGFLDWEVQALVDWDQAYDGFIQLFQAAASR